MRVVFLAVILSLAFLQPVYSQETSTVITQGIGKDVESAVQRGAEAALIQVVGSFIDSKKLIEKRKEIRDGIRTRTKSVSSKLSEYSQGSIKRLEVLDTSQEDGLTRVTTKVTVRIEDFKRYIKETVLAERKVKTGLLAKMKLGKKQGKNLFDLLSNKVIRPVFEYKVVIPKIGEIRQVTAPKAVTLFKPSVGQYLIAFDVDVKLNPNYLANASRVLEEIAEKKYSCRQYKKDKFGRYPAHSVLIGLGVLKKKGKKIARRLGDPDCNFGAQEVFVGPFGGPLMKSQVIYGFKENQINLCSRLYKAFGLQDEYNSRSKVFKPFLQIKFVSASGQVVEEESFNTIQRFYFGGVPSSGNSFILPAKGYGYEKSAAPALMSWSKTKGYRGNRCSFFIKKHAKFRIFSKVTEEVFGKTDKIVLSYAE
jgi:hypothetical protein